jgi:hypothetical protein
MHQEKILLKGNKLGKFYNAAWVTRWIIFIGVAFLSTGKPRTAWAIFWIVDLLMVVYTVLCLNTFMNICGILILVEEICLLIWHFWIFEFFLEGTTTSPWKTGTIKFWSYVVLFLYLICMVIEIVLLFMGGKMCFKPKTTMAGVAQTPTVNTNGDNHFKVELPDTAKANLNGGTNAI